MSTTSLTAGEVMDRSAALMNDPAKTDYTYIAQLPYLNMAIDELVENLMESNSSPTNQTSSIISVPVGSTKLVSVDTPGVDPKYPVDLVEIQSISERNAGSQDVFVALTRGEFVQGFPAAHSLLFWVWQDQQIKFNPNGALSTREILINYVRYAINSAINETSVIGAINARSYLTFKTAAFCSQFIGEDTTRAGILNEQADLALERIIGINNKGKQQIMTRHRPFRASYKTRSY